MFCPRTKGNLLALAEGAKSRYWPELLEAVPLAPGFAPIQFIGEPLGRIFHRDQKYRGSNHIQPKTSVKDCCLRLSSSPWLQLVRHLGQKIISLVSLLA